MDGGQTFGGDTSGTWRTDGVVTGGDAFGFMVFGTSTSGGTHVSTERRCGARSGAGAARGRYGLVMVWRRRAEGTLTAAQLEELRAHMWGPPAGRRGENAIRPA